MAFAENLAAEKGLRRMLALSTQAFNYFQQKGGFEEATPDVLPPERREKYDASGRNSKVLIKNVVPQAHRERSRDASSPGDLSTD